MKNWPLFDQMRLSEMPCGGVQLPLTLSIRYFREVIVCGEAEINTTDMLAKAIDYACRAVEESNYLDASSFSQLAHCIRIAEHYSESFLLQSGCTKNELEGLQTEFFNQSNALDPNRQFLPKEEQWRQAEREYLKNRVSIGATLP
jgi:hypothetical protein